VNRRGFQEPGGRSNNVPAPTPQPSTTPPASAAYKDGTYTGRGTSRHGDITATVVVKGGKIVSADVADCSTRYPCNLVQPLVTSVVSTQAAPTRRISGATDSSNAYRQAIGSALTSARA
jgi:uncharacterized protein with FMN-binding domain